MKELNHSNGVHVTKGHPRPTIATNGTPERCDMNGKSKTTRKRSSRRINDDGTLHFNEATTAQELAQPPPTPIDDGPTPVEAGDHEAAVMDVPTRLQILQDMANLCTLAGAILATLAMASMWQGKYYIGMSLNVAANIADILDGPIARATTNRHPAFAIVGCKLDCYSDLVSHFVVPASLLMHLSAMHPVCTVLAAFYICAGILRQSYFEVTGRCEGGSCIYGMTSDYMVAIYSIGMHVFPLVAAEWMPCVMSAYVVAMIFSSLTFAIRSRRYDGFGLFTVTAYNIFLFFSCLVLVLFQDSEHVFQISGTLFLLNLLLAYPCYFRFVELNR